MKEIFEFQSAALKLEHKDGRTKEEITPTKITWQLDDIRSDTNIISSTEETPTGNVFYIEIPSDSNVIEDLTNDEEEKAVSVKSEFSGGKVAILEYIYLVKKMGFYHP